MNRLGTLRPCQTFSKDKNVTLNIQVFDNECRLNKRTSVLKLRNDDVVTRPDYMGNSSTFLIFYMHTAGNLKRGFHIVKKKTLKF